MGDIFIIYKNILRRIVPLDLAEILHGGPHQKNIGTCNLFFLIVSAILDLFGVLWKTLDPNSDAILILISSKFGTVVEGPKFSGSFLNFAKIFINEPARGRQSSDLGRLWGYIAAILNLPETIFLA